MIINPARHDDAKEINLKKYLPANLVGSETETFLEFFETYLNELYVGNTKYTDTSALDDIAFTKEIIVTEDSPNVYSRGGDFLTNFVAGDYLQVFGTDAYNSIYSIIDEEILILDENYTSSVASSGSGYYENFSRDSYGLFWDANSVEAPEGMDDNLKNFYTLDIVNDKIVYNPTELSGGTDTYVIANEVSGSFYSMEMGFNLAKGTYRNNEFGIILAEASVDLSASNNYVQVFFDGDNVNLKYDSTTKVFPLDSTVDDFRLLIEKDADDFNFILKGVKTSDIETTTWSSNISGTSGSPDAGYHNTYTYSVSASPTDVSQTWKLGLRNGVKQGFDSMFFKTTNGFKGKFF